MKVCDFEYKHAHYNITQHTDDTNTSSQHQYTVYKIDPKKHNVPKDNIIYDNHTFEGTT